MTKTEIRQEIDKALAFYKDNKLDESIKIIQGLYLNNQEAKMIMMEDDEIVNIVIEWAYRSENELSKAKEKVEDEPAGENSCCSCSTTS